MAQAAKTPQGKNQRKKTPQKPGTQPPPNETSATPHEEKKRTQRPTQTPTLKEVEITASSHTFLRRGLQDCLALQRLAQ